MSNFDYQSIRPPIEEVQHFLKEYYTLSGKLTELPGSIDFNFHLKTENSEEYTFKVSRPEVNVQELEFQAATMLYLAKKELPLQLSEVILSKNGRLFEQIEDINGHKRYLRLQKWVSGNVIAKVNPHTPQLLFDWGKSVALISKGLQGFDHPFAHRFMDWNPSETLYSKKYIEYFQTSEQVEIVNYFWDLFEKKTLPLLPSLRKSISHLDGNDYNVLVQKNGENVEITGIIDFGDALYSETINDLAIACAYACMDKNAPLETATHLVQGFNSILPLEEKELEVLFSLIAARLNITVSTAAYSKYKEPENEYLLISERPAWDLLEKWRKIPPNFAHYTFRSACGLEPCPKAILFQKWLKEEGQNCGDLIDFEGKKTTPLDLSVGSLDLGNNSNFENNTNFERTIQRILEENKADIAVGGYSETRPVYTTDAYLVERNNGPIWRTVHIGLDLWTEAETPVFVPFDGTIHSFQNNALECDYGPTILVEHKVSEILTFYTLYGHLTLDSLDNLSVGMPVQKGQQIAKIGAAPINGNWPPHLHFQVILDLMGGSGDFPGVCFPSEAPIWLSICPALPFKGISQINHFKTQTNQEKTQKILATRKQNLGRSLSISYKEPLHIVRGYKQYLYDTSGRRYLDTVNNVAHVGHEHPAVVRAAQRQNGLLNTNTRYLHPNITQFAEELLATFPPELSVVHFVNSGSEANELALRMANACTGEKDMIAVEVGYHGNTNGCIDISSYKFDGKGGKGAPPHTHIVPIPDSYRGIYRGENTGHQYAQHIQKAIEKTQKEGRNIAGFICESILSCGGQIVLPPNYLQEAFQYVRAAGGICIADEVQVGFGRVGTHFWGFELQNVVPDIVTMGKPIGNGHPLAAVVTTPEVAERFANGMEYFNTFGGNPVSCAIGSAVLKTIKEESLQQNALETGNYLFQKLKELQKKHPIIGDVRGQGLFLGFELVEDRETLIPAAASTAYLANRMREHGILMSTDGPFHNVLKIKPPMCFNRDNADFLLKYLEKILEELR